MSTESLSEHASIYPPPPIYYKNYKDVNIILDKSNNLSNMYIIDTDNINLKPPNIPSKLIDLNNKVKEIKLADDIPILYKLLENGSIDYINSLPYLFKLLKSQYSIFLNTLLISNDPLSPYLLDSLLRIDNTNSYIQQSKILSNSVSKEINQLRYIYSNISYLINSMRYHQAKESLLVAMKNQYNMLENYHKELLERCNKTREFLEPKESIHMDIEKEIIPDIIQLNNEQIHDINLNNLLSELDAIPRDFKY